MSATFGRRGVSALHQAVARAIAKTMRQPGGWTEADLAAAAVGVVLAEATQSIEALPAVTSDYDGSEGRLLDDVLAVLAALGEHDG